MNRNYLSCIKSLLIVFSMTFFLSSLQATIVTQSKTVKIQIPDLQEEIKNELLDAIKSKDAKSVKQILEKHHSHINKTEVNEIFSEAMEAKVLNTGVILLFLGYEDICEKLRCEILDRCFNYVARKGYAGILKRIAQHETLSKKIYRSSETKDCIEKCFERLLTSIRNHHKKALDVLRSSSVLAKKLEQFENEEDVEFYDSEKICDTQKDLEKSFSPQKTLIEPEESLLKQPEHTQQKIQPIKQLDDYQLFSEWSDDTFDGEHEKKIKRTGNLLKIEVEIKSLGSDDEDSDSVLSEEDDVDEFFYYVPSEEDEEDLEDEIPDTSCDDASKTLKTVSSRRNDHTFDGYHEQKIKRTGNLLKIGTESKRQEGGDDENYDYVLSEDDEEYSDSEEICKSSKDVKDQLLDAIELKDVETVEEILEKHHSNFNQTEVNEVFRAASFQKNLNTGVVLAFFAYRDICKKLRGEVIDGCFLNAARKGYTKIARNIVNNDILRKKFYSDSISKERVDQCLKWLLKIKKVKSSYNTVLKILQSDFEFAKVLKGLQRVVSIPSPQEQEKKKNATKKIQELFRKSLVRFVGKGREKFIGFANKDAFEQFLASLKDVDEELFVKLTAVPDIIKQREAFGASLGLKDLQRSTQGQIKKKRAGNKLKVSEDEDYDYVSDEEDGDEYRDIEETYEISKNVKDKLLNAIELKDAEEVEQILEKYHGNFSQAEINEVFRETSFQKNMNTGVILAFFAYRDICKKLSGKIIDRCFVDAARKSYTKIVRSMVNNDILRRKFYSDSASKESVDKCLKYLLKNKDVRPPCNTVLKILQSDFEFAKILKDLQQVDQESSKEVVFVSRSQEQVKKKRTGSKLKISEDEDYVLSDDDEDYRDIEETCKKKKRQLSPIQIKISTDIPKELIKAVVSRDVKAVEEIFKNYRSFLTEEEINDAFEKTVVRVGKDRKIEDILLLFLKYEDIRRNLRGDLLDKSFIDPLLIEGTSTIAFKMFEYEDVRGKLYSSNKTKRFFELGLKKVKNDYKPLFKTFLSFPELANKAQIALAEDDEKSKRGKKKKRVVPVQKRILTGKAEELFKAAASRDIETVEEIIKNYRSFLTEEEMNDAFEQAVIRGKNGRTSEEILLLFLKYEDVRKNLREDLLDKCFINPLIEGTSTIAFKMLEYDDVIKKLYSSDQTERSLGLCLKRMVRNRKVLLKKFLSFPQLAKKSKKA